MFAVLEYGMDLSHGQVNAAFDGRPWNISTGNLSVSFIQASPIGAFPKPNYLEAPPSVESLVRLKNLGLVADEDYVAWGAVEREPGKWDWQQHDAVEHNLHAAGMKYVAYIWAHFPPAWLKEKRTLMRCLEHNKETSYLSIFDPQTIEWYDHFYRNLHDHFGDRIDNVYACILGPYGEGNYPLEVKSWVNMGHCHEGYWCGDDYAIRAFQTAMQKKYSRISRLNAAWGTHFKSFAEVRPLAEISENFKPSPAAFPTAQDKRRWLDFIGWYHQAIIDFAEKSLQTVLKYFPAEKVRMKPGGNAGGVNPVSWGTYCPGYAKMAGKYGVVLQPADCQGAVFGDKWVGTAYQYYGVKECTEPAGDLDEHAFVRRMFSDASCGARQLFSYQFEQHCTNIQKYVHLFTGEPGETGVAVYCPTTLYRLGASLQPTISAGWPLRDLCEFDVLDELLIRDGALNTRRYQALLIFQGDIVEQDILDKIAAFRRAGGKMIVFGDAPIKNVEGKLWRETPKLVHLSTVAKNGKWLKELSIELGGIRGVDGKLDGLWTCRRSRQMFVFNSKGKPVETIVDGESITIEPYAIWMNEAAARKN
ncbi:MAG TPA: family 14 glycosylhydrolase [Verrucomicrobiae bacterium]|nr:family 14 glycosylhydrolase [Verrucomicrobiae bacterium]